MNQALRHNRPTWLAYLRACHAQDEQKRREGDRFSISSIIPFGAARWWGEEAARETAQALARPLPALVVDAGEEGVTVRLQCPYCHQPHEHVFVVWPEGAVNAPCGEGEYRLFLQNICAPDGEAQD